jgi:hypothetical protein
MLWIAAGFLGIIFMIVGAVFYLSAVYEGVCISLREGSRPPYWGDF